MFHWNVLWEMASLWKPPFETFIFKTVAGEKETVIWRGSGRAGYNRSSWLRGADGPYSTVTNRQLGFLFKYIPRFSIGLCHVHPALAASFQDCKVSKAQQRSYKNQCLDDDSNTEAKNNKQRNKDNEGPGGMMV